MRHVAVGINVKACGHKPPGQAQCVNKSADHKRGPKLLFPYSLNPEVFPFEVLFSKRPSNKLKWWVQRAPCFPRQAVKVAIVRVRIDV